MKIDGIRSYNTFKRVWLIDDPKGSNREQHKQVITEVFVDRGRIEADSVIVNGISTYTIKDDPNYDNYVCQWDATPFKVNQDRALEVGEDEAPVLVYKGGLGL